MKSLEHDHQQVKWYTESIYIDIETGELLDKEYAKKHYTIIKKIKRSNVYKATGTTTITNECRRDIQGKLF